MYGRFVWWSFNFPTFPASTFSPFPFPLSPFPFPLSPFPFPLSPFPFPKCIFPWPLLMLTHFPHCPVVVLKVVFIFVLPCCHDCHRCCLLSTTGVQLFSKRGGFVFSVFCGAFFPWGGGWKAPDSGGGGMGGSRGGGSCEEFGVDNGGGWGCFRDSFSQFPLDIRPPLDPPPIDKNIRHLLGQTAHTTPLIRHQTSDFIHNPGFETPVRYPRSPLPVATVEFLAQHLCDRTSHP